MDFFSFSFKHSSPQSSTFYHPDRMAKCHLQRFIFSSFSPRLTPPSSTSVALLRHLPPYPLVHLNLSTDTPFTAHPESHLLLLYKAFPGPLPGVTFLPLNTPQVFMHMTLGTRTFTFCTHLSPRDANISRIAACLAHLFIFREARHRAWCRGSVHMRVRQRDREERKERKTEGVSP